MSFFMALIFPYFIKRPFGLHTQGRTDLRQGVQLASPYGGILSGLMELCASSSANSFPCHVGCDYSILPLKQSLAGGQSQPASDNLKRKIL
jgi:hypothetical protein